MIYAGVDIAKTDHVIGAVDERGAEMCPPMPFKNTEAGLERAVAWLEGLAGSPSDVVVGMEATGHYWMACYSFLVARGYSVAVINPMQVKAVRKLKGLDKVKNDRVDAGLIAEALRIGCWRQYIFHHFHQRIFANRANADTPDSPTRMRR